MTTPESINCALDDAVIAINKVTEAIAALQPAETLSLLKAVEHAIADLHSVKTLLYASYPNLKQADLSKFSLNADKEISGEYASEIAKLSPADIKIIDNVLLKLTPTQWRKMAFIVGAAMNELSDPIFDSIPDSYFASRVRKLIVDGVLEYQGSLSLMRYCEVKRKND